VVSRHPLEKCAPSRKKYFKIVVKIAQTAEPTTSKTLHLYLLIRAALSDLLQMSHMLAIMSSPLVVVDYIATIAWKLFRP
jgi:hypothetical protein